MTLGGAIRCGKTQSAARLIVEMALEQPAVYLVARSTYRSLKDSTQKAMLHGDGALPPLIPHQAMLGGTLTSGYRASDEQVTLANGGQIIFRSLEESQVGKLLNLTLGGILVDQIEELDGGDAGERIFDTLLGRLSDPRGPRKLLAVANPSGLTHWVYRRLVNDATRDPDARYIHFRLTDNAQNLPADYVAAMEATKNTRPHWYRSFIRGEWGAFEGAAFEEFSDDVHVIEPFAIPDEWERFESMDHGATNPTAWHAWAVDFDGNLIVFDEYYSPGLVSKHAPEILRRRRQGRNAWERDGRPNTCYADPSIAANIGLTNRWGAPASILTEYGDLGLHLTRGNNDRQAGYMRLLELIHMEPGRVRPAYARDAGSSVASPRLYLFRTCRNVIEQLQSAPIARDGASAGECVDPTWESAHGHATASLRYGAMSRPSPTERPAKSLRELLLEPGDDVDLRAEALRAHIERVERPTRRRYQWT